MSLAQARRECDLADSYSRMGVVMRWYPVRGFDGSKIRSDAWWRLLGEQWSTCDNIAEWSDVLRHLLQTAPREHVALMMSRAEREALEALPSEFTVWRGCYGFNAEGLSWSTDRAVAAAFPFLNRYRRAGARPVLVEAKCSRADAVLKLDRGESEVISARVTVQSVVELAESPA